MKYTNPTMRKVKNTHILEVACNFCKTPILIYQKGGRGNLIKLQIPRVVEAEFDLEKLENALLCPNCERQLGSLSDYRGKPTYYLTRGHTTSKRLPHYSY